MSKRSMLNVEVSVSKGWLAQRLGVAFDRDYYLDPQRRRQIDRKCHECVERELADLDALFTESNLGRRPWFDARQALVGGIQPNMILGMLLGAELLPAEDRDADITPGCWADRDVGDLPSTDDLAAHPLIEQFTEQIRAIKSAGQWTAIPPFFWDASGRAAVHGPLTTAQKFLGERVFLDLVTEPEPCRRMMQWVTDANAVLVRHFADVAEIEIEQLHVGECAACMIGADLFEQFVVPELNRAAELIGPLRLHSCGASNHLLAACRGIDRLASFDLGGETSLARVRESFGPQLPVSIAPLVADLSAAAPAGLIAWAERVVQENDGGPLTVLFHIEPSYRLDVLRTFHAALQRLAS